MGDRAAKEGESPLDLASKRVGGIIRGGWRLDKLIGFGPLAAVYAATHQSGRAATVKVMRLELVGDPALRARFLREAQLARKVSHKAVVAFYEDAETQRGEPYLVMETLQGRTLQSLWERGGKRLPLVESLRIAQQIIAALVALHRAHVVHHDLTPTNVLVSKNGEVKVLGLGAAAAEDAERARAVEHEGLEPGNPAFMAPERALGKAVDHRSDLYAVGAILYMLLGGELLNQGASARESLAMAATQPAPSIARVAPQLPAAAVALVDKALKWDPGARHQTAAQLRDHLVSVLAVVDRADADAGPGAGAGFELDFDRGQGGRDERSRAEGRREDGSTAQPALAPGSAPRETTAGAAERELAPLPPTTAVPLPADHPLSPVFVAFDHVVRASRAGVGSRAEASRFGELAFEALTRALPSFPDGVELRVHPFGFQVEAQMAWEPTELDPIPHALRSAGVRELHLRAGIEPGELRQLVALLVAAPSMSSEELATAFWEAPFRHVRCVLDEEQVELSALGAAEGEVAELERALEIHQQHALKPSREAALGVDMMASLEAVSASTASLLRLDPESHRFLTAATRLGTADLRARHDRLLAQAFEDAARRRDLDPLVQVVADHARHLVRLGAEAELFDTHRVLLTHFDDPRHRASGMTAAFVTATLFPGDVLHHVVSRANGEGEGGERERELFLRGFSAIARSLPAQALSVFLKLAELHPSGPVMAPIVELVVRVVEGHEDVFLAHLAAMSPSVSVPLLAAVVAETTEATKAKLRPLLKSAEAELRCEALAILAPDANVVARELTKVVETGGRRLRTAALDALVRHNVRAAGPRLVALVESESFARRLPDDQREILEALFALNAPRTEQLLAALAQKHGLMKNEELEPTRVLAVRMLGERGASRDTLAAIQEAEALRPWNSAELRAAAAEAIRAMRARLPVDVAAEPGAAAEPPAGGTRP